MIGFFRRHIAVKLFFSYLIVILIGFIVLATSAELAVPGAFSRHLAIMASMMDSMMGSDVSLTDDLYQSFRSAVTEAVLTATFVSAVAAVITSMFVSRQVVAPLKAMMQASQRIAEGQYQERVAVRGSVSKGELDELGALAISFNRMAASLEETEQMRRQLIADVTHELRTPLTTIQGYMEGLVDGVLPPADETYMAVYREADRLKRLVNDLQELSQVEAGAFQLNLEAVSPSALIRPVVARMSPQFAEKNVSLREQLPDSLPNVCADVDRVQQVLVNLLGNALQFTPSGGDVQVSARHADRFVEIIVRDSGIGIPPEQLQRIFTRFYRVDKSRSRVAGGSGIGLTISRYIVEAHQGAIRAESPGVDQGSTFVFTLPVCKPV